MIARGWRLRFGVLPPSPGWGDIGPFSAVVEPHEYLFCDPCGQRLYVGVTDNGAAILVCRACQIVADTRRIA